MRSKYILIASGVVAAIALATVVVSAGNPSTPPGPPETTFSYTLEDIYDRLTTGVAGTQTTFTEPVSGPADGTMHTLNDIMGVAPALDSINGATAADVLTGQTFWGMTGGQWGATVGIMSDNGAVILMPTTAQQTIAMGYHDGNGYVEGDADLVAGNIKAGVNLFGVMGTLAGDTTYEAGVPQTGQTKCYDASGTQIACTGTGQDGDLQKGVEWITSTRFITGTTGVVTDTLTGLIWLENANCFGQRNWSTALNDANTLNSGECGLSDGSSEGNWRLPNVRELQSLIDYGEYDPALPDSHPFTGVVSSGYWSSSTYMYDQSWAWPVYITDGRMHAAAKTAEWFVWPVRGGP